MPGRRQLFAIRAQRQATDALSVGIPLTTSLSVLISSVRSLGARQQVPFDNQAVGGRRVRTRPIFAKRHVRDALQMAARKTLDQFTVINRIQMNGSVLGAQRNNINLATLLFMLLPITSTPLLPRRTFLMDCARVPHDKHVNLGYFSSENSALRDCEATSHSLRRCRSTEGMMRASVWPLGAYWIMLNCTVSAGAFSGAILRIEKIKKITTHPDHRPIVTARQLESIDLHQTAHRAHKANRC
jgi:hypothetical protein